MRSTPGLYRRARRGTPPQLEALALFTSTANQQQGHALPTAHFFIAFVAFIAFMAFIAFIAGASSAAAFFIALRFMAFFIAFIAFIAFMAFIAFIAGASSAAAFIAPM